MNSHLGKGSSSTLSSLQPGASGSGVILQAVSDPGWDGVGPLWSSPLWKCPGGV